MKKKNMIFLVVTILVLIAVLGASYAYFTAELGGAETGTTITAKGGTMHINFDGGNNITVSNIIPDNNPAASKTFTLTGNNTTELNMPYTLSLIVDENTFSNDAISYSLTGVNTSGSGTLVPNKTNITLATSTGTYELGKGNFVSGSEKIHTYTLDIYFLDNSEINQNADQGKTFKAHIEVSSALNYSLADFIISFTSNSEETGVYYEKMNSYFYQGLNVNNYISFNNELWRIIGVFGDNTHGIANANLVKIIRESQAPESDWGENGKNRWEESYIYPYLNNEYYNEIDSTYKNMIKKVEWNHGHYYYFNEADTTYISDRGGYYSVLDFVGILLPSDYAYSVPATLCKRYMSFYEYPSNECAANSWLVPEEGSEWFLAPNPLYFRVWGFNDQGAVRDKYCFETAKYRPVVYLNENVIYQSGDGSKDSPYILGSNAL